MNHPLLQDTLEALPSSTRSRIERVFNVITQSFPTDVFYTDKANDELEISLGELEESAALELCRELIQAFRNCGLPAEEIRAKLLATEIPGACASIIEGLITKEFQDE